MVAQYDYERLAIDIRNFMNRNNITGRQFCELCGADESTLSRLLSGKIRHVRFETVDKMASALGLTAEYYEMQKQQPYESMSIEDLTALIMLLQDIRNRKLEEELPALREKTKLYEQLWKERESELSLA